MIQCCQLCGSRSSSKFDFGLTLGASRIVNVFQSLQSKITFWHFELVTLCKFFIMGHFTETTSFMKSP